MQFFLSAARGSTNRGLTSAHSRSGDCCGSPSPEADQQQRMALQIELINQGLSNMRLVDDQQLIERWCASGPKSPADEPLRVRFFTALAQRPRA